MNERDLYKALSYYNTYKALRRGPDALLRRIIRIFLYRLSRRVINQAVGRSRKQNWI